MARHNIGQRARRSAGSCTSRSVPLTAGLIVSTIRWLVIDTLHHWTGIREPRWDFARLQENVTAFDVLVEIHYRYYQFYGNMLVSVAFVYACRRLALGFWSSAVGRTEVAVVLLECLLLAGSRDTFRKYYARSGVLLRKQSLKQKGTSADEGTAD